MVKWAATEMNYHFKSLDAETTKVILTIDD